MSATIAQTRQPSVVSARYYDICEAIHCYVEAVNNRDVSALEPLLANIWHSKRARANGQLDVEQPATFLKRVKSGEASCPSTLTMVASCFEDLAVARIEDWSAFEARFVLAFMEAGAWKVAGEISADASACLRDEKFMARGAELAILEVLQEYYRAVAASDGSAIRRIFEPAWHMKNHNGAGELVDECSETFIRRLEEARPSYRDDRQISDIQVIGDRIAYVRVDRPSTPSTTVFFFARGRNGWKIADKAWTDGRRKPNA